MKPMNSAASLLALVALSRKGRLAAVDTAVKRGRFEMNCPEVMAPSFHGK
jgi:hypothetical protein